MEHDGTSADSLHHASLIGLLVAVNSFSLTSPHSAHNQRTSLFVPALVITVVEMDKFGDE